MRKKLLIIFCLTCFQSPLLSLKLDNLAMFGAGVASGIVSHEASHAIALVALGGSVDQFNFTSVRGHFPSNLSQSEYESKMRIFTLSGYLTQGLISEAILQNESWHENDFAIGWMSIGIFNNLNNVYLYYIKNDRDHDLGYYEKNGGNPAIPAMVMVAHSAFVLYRIFSNTEIPDHFIGRTLGVQIKF
jgi:hypothetical protein